jgi:hypothetical protein
MTSTACSGRAGYSDWTTSSGVCTRKEMTDLYVLEKVGFRIPEAPMEVEHWQEARQGA